MFFFTEKSNLVPNAILSFLPVFAYTFKLVDLWFCLAHLSAELLLGTYTKTYARCHKNVKVIPGLSLEYSAFSQSFFFRASINPTYFGLANAFFSCLFLSFG